jgi:hypothetical protein
MTNSFHTTPGGPRCSGGPGTTPLRGHQVEDLVGDLFSGPDEAQVRRWLRGLLRPGPLGGGRKAAGEKRVVAVTKKPQEAKDKAVVIENDFKTLGPAAWCERYDVPLSFVSG